MPALIVAVAPSSGEIALAVALALVSFLGGVVFGPWVSHRLAGVRLREDAEAQRNAAERTADRERVLSLRKKVKGFTDQVGGRWGSPFTNDGLADQWDEDQRLRAGKYKRLVGTLATELDDAASAFHDATLRWITVIAARVAEQARSALDEGRPSAAANVAAAVVEDVEKVLDS